MRVLYIHQYFVTPAGYGGTRSYELARRLVAAGHQVTLITSSAFFGSDLPSSHNWSYCEVAGINIHVVHIPYSNRMSYSQRMKAFVEFATKASLHARSQPADVVFASSTPLTIAIPGIYAAKCQNKPLVLEIRDLWPQLPIDIGVLRGRLPIKVAYLLERVAYASSKHIIALSPGMRDSIVETGYPHDQITVIPNGCDLELFKVEEARGMAFRQQFEWLSDRPLVVYTGTLGAVNQVEYLAHVASYVYCIDPEIRFLVVGDGMQREFVETQASKLGVLNHNFFMLAPIPKQQVPDVLSAATVTTSLFMPIQTMWSNSANKFFDGLAAGCPVALNYGGWQADLIEDTGAGIILPSTDYGKAAAMLVAFIRDAEKLTRARTAAYRLATDRFSRDALAKQLENVLVRVAQKKQ
jgi:glycosyltransferase involved in cell wall biosynthesis